MSKIKRYIINNFIELITAVSLFIGLPVTVSLYFDYRAGLLLLFVATSVFGIIALRKS